MNKKEVFFLILILFLAIFFRLWKLNEIPPGVHPDAARNGMDALDAIENNKYKVFYPENFGREGLFINLQSLSIRIFGIYPFSLEIVSALIGIATVFGSFLLTKEILDTRIALITSFLLASSFWHTLFSRLGLRGIMLPCALVFSFYFLSKGLKTRKIINFIFAGGFFGLGFHTYTPFRMSVLILPLIFIPQWFLYKKTKEQKKFFIFACAFFFSAFLVSLPLIIYFLNNPQDFFGRTSEVLIFSQKDFLKIFATNLFAHLGMFNIYGDPNWRHNLSQQPMLPCYLGIFLVGGMILVCKRLFKEIKEKETDLFLLGWFLIMLLPSLLTYSPGGIPHALRSLGLVPVVYIFIGIFLDFLISYFSKIEPQYDKIFLGCLILFLFIVSLSEGKKYFYDWGKNYKVRESFFENFVNAAYYLKSIPTEICVTDRANEMEYITYKNKNIHYFFPWEIEKIQNFCNHPGNLIVIIDYSEEKKEIIEKEIIKKKIILEPEIFFGLGGKSLKIFTVGNSI